ncbi:hypothetical protein J6524_10040 [Bradyrhizobium sp. WSM 1738]|uniref:hypothetical protein n=1 Tax=Bradyrhizobium hereditatis TaxID=2821405 RepID=UPI001CE28C86|nr:hypothetical protein [Bradyrhizobium hereditatis]MCA6115234.1 hypothetical protein [Bradyrhizobium hereditatis]
MKASGDLRQLRHHARFTVNPDLLQYFITTIVLDLGFCCIAPCPTHGCAFDPRERRLPFPARADRHRRDHQGDDLQARVADEIARLGAMVDEVQTKARIAAHDAEKVFLTGGASFVRAERRLFAETLWRGSGHTARQSGWEVHREHRYMRQYALSP